MNDFWLSCGYHLLDRNAVGELSLTDEFLKAYLARPELTPPSNACAAERALHETLLGNPRRLVEADEIAAIADQDARENWQLMIAFRDHLIAHHTIEAAYLALARDGKRVPPLFFDQLVHVILRNVLDRTDDAFLLRAAELYFRTQRVTTYEGALLAADDEHVGAAAAAPLAAMFGTPLAENIEVLNEASAPTYWRRSDRFDMALDLTAGRRGLAAVGAVAAHWIEHLLAVEVEIEPVIELRDISLAWYVGLDAEATRLGDVLWRDGVLPEEEHMHIVAIYRLAFSDPTIVLDRVAGEEVYLILATTPEGKLRVKPQNLLTGLPIRHVATAL